LPRFIAILFLSLQLLTNTELCQLIKLPVLIEHYKEHGGIDNGISFFAFLKMHYFNGDAKDADYERDMQLPFKTNAGALIISHSHSVPVPSSAVVLILPEKEIVNHFNKNYVTWIPSEKHNDIFQPPRFSRS
jgi:hypothetical protein